MENPFDLDSRDMNLIQTLISEVAKRPLLWDRYDNNYNNRQAMDHEWGVIATMLNKDKDFVKYKWRNLRDQFQKERKKVKVPFGNPTRPYIQYYRGMWMYFEQMLFLKDVPTTKRTTSSTCHSSPRIQILDPDVKEELIVFEDDSMESQLNNFNNDSDNNEREPSTCASNEETLDTIQPKTEIIEDPEVCASEVFNSEVYNLEEDQFEEIGRKRRASETRSDSVISTKILKPSVAEAATNTEDLGEIDDDLHFVKSLVPYLRKLSPIRKLIVRNEIQNLLIRESLCENCKFGKVTSHDS